MQLSPRRSRGFRVRFFAFVVVVAVGALTRATPAAAADEPASAERDSASEKSASEKKEPAAATRPADTSTKRASLEFASYKDSDHITVITPSITGRVENVTTGASISGSYLLDVVSAASVDIVSTASRRWQESRHAGAIGGEYKPKNFGVAVSGSASREPDYFAYGFAVQMSQDFDEKNTSIVGGYGYGHDTIGRGSTPFSVFSREVNRGTFNGGITQVINRTTVAGLSFDLMIENGDQSKPYRYIPMFTSAVAANVPKGASIDYVTSHRSPERPLEQLPLSRRRLATTGRIAHRFEGSTLRASERIYFDTWGLSASTTDARWVFDVVPRVSLGPHTRFHIQSPVSFWQRAYTSSGQGWSIPEFRTGDRELGPLWTVTGGGGVKVNIGSAAEPRKWAIGLDADAMYTSFLNDLYLTSRTGLLGAMTLEAEL